MSFKYRIIIVVLCTAIFAPLDIIQGSLFTNYFFGILIVYWGYLILFSNRYFASNSLFVQRFPSLNKLYQWYLKKEFQLAALYIGSLDMVILLVNTVASRILGIVPISLDWSSAQ